MIAWFDIFSGISGDMTLGAFIDLGVPIDWLKEALYPLFSSIEDAHDSDQQYPCIRCESIMRNGIKAVNFFVDIVDNKENSNLYRCSSGSDSGIKSCTGHACAGHNTHARNYKDIKNIILASKLSPKVKSLSLSAFKKIAKAESEIHGLDIDNVHFHEVGAIDSIIDIVGSFLCIEFLGITEVYASEIPLGKGFVKCSHGTLPVPAPAVMAILKGIPVKNSDIEMEIVTPTGAAIITTLASSFGSMPDMVIDGIGYGSGKNMADSDIPNLLRIITGRKVNRQVMPCYTGRIIDSNCLTNNKKAKGELPCIDIQIDGSNPGRSSKEKDDYSSCKQLVGNDGSITGNTLKSKGEIHDGRFEIEEVFVVETSIDDIIPEILGYLMERLMAEGALDVCHIPVQMKKNRPGTRLEVLCRQNKLARILCIIFHETTTTGIRYHKTNRAYLSREIIFIDTCFGKIQVKKITGIDGVERIAPEYDICCDIALKENMSLRDVYAQVCLDINRNKIL